MNNLKTTQLADIKVTVGKTSLTYGVVCQIGDKDETLFKKAKARARTDFGDLLDTKVVSYELVSRKTLNS